MPPPSRPPASRLDGETLAYFRELDTAFRALTSDEERALAADSALEEAGARGAEVAADASCSRVLEGLLPHATTPALCAFVAACVEGEALGSLCTQ